MIAERSDGGAIDHLGDLGQAGILARRKNAAEVAKQQLLGGKLRNARFRHLEQTQALGHALQALLGRSGAHQQQHFVGASLFKKLRDNRAAQETRRTGNQQSAHKLR